MGNDLSAEYWNKRYLSNDFGWDLGAVSTPLKTYFDQLKDPNISILIPGAGNAYEAEYLFNLGFKNVFVCDLAPAPLEALQQRCPGFDASHLLLSDFFALEGQFDLMVEQTFFCAIHPTLRQKYFEKAAKLIKPGGHLVGLLFDDQLNDDRPPFGGNKQEYLGYIHEPFVVKTLEASYNSVKPRQGRELFINLVRH